MNELTQLDEVFMALLLAVGPSPYPGMFTETTSMESKEEWRAWRREAMNWWEGHPLTKGLGDFPRAAFETWQMREEKTLKLTRHVKGREW